MHTTKALKEVKITLIKELLKMMLEELTLKLLKFL